MSDLPDPTLSTALLRTALSQIDDVLLITEAEPFDMPGPRIIYVNDAFTKMTGYTLEEVYGKTPRILQGPETSGEARATIRAALERWEPVRVELTNYRKDGTTFEVDLSIQPIWEGEWVTHWVAVQRDVTEAREAARKRIHEDRLRSLGMLSGSIAHDFNNILHALGVMLEFMEGEEDPEQLAQLHADVRYALKRGDDMATRLLAFSRPERGKVEEVDLAEVLERTLDLCLKGSDTTRTLKAPRDPVRVMADPTQVSQVFMNLTLNARQAMSDAGHLDVTVSRLEGGRAQVSFEDGGPGFAPEQLAAAFEPFHTTRSTGTGLGLSIVHGIVTHLGGEVTLGNAPGGGAKICTTWEVVEDDGPSEPPHVLVVEDDALNRKLTMRLLGVLGYTSEGMETAEQALERVKTSAFDMALIDINLGSGMKGSELASRLIGSSTIEQVVFMSANHDLAEGLKNISPHFLSKPFTRSQLNEMMKSCVAG